MSLPDPSSEPANADLGEILVELERRRADQGRLMAEARADLLAAFGDDLEWDDGVV